MNNNITVSAPGKLMLFGEHAVVYHRPCLATSVGQRMKATVELTDKQMFSLQAPDVKVTGYIKPMMELGKGEIPKGANFVEVAVRNFSEKYPLQSGLTVMTSSEFSSQFGFGSSSASTVCVVKALAELSGKKLSNKELFDIAYKTVLDIQGRASGFDVAVALYGGILYFVGGGSVIEPLAVHDVPLIIGYSGEKGDSVTLIERVAKLKESNPQDTEHVFDCIANLVEQAKKAVLKNNWQQIGALMNLNHERLRGLGVSSEKLEQLVAAANNSGAYGAKLSGAGGGDCIIAIAASDKRAAVAEGIRKAGGEVIDIKTNVEGSRIEHN